jgi:glutaminyl-peptide cyclotransferase
MIPNPFPSVWHTPDDDAEHLDIDTCEDWAVLVAAFAAEWMDLEGFMVGSAQSSREKRDDDDTLDRRKEAIVSKTEL